MKKKTNGRDFAIGVLDQFFDDLGVFEEDRIHSNIEKPEKVGAHIEEQGDPLAIEESIELRKQYEAELLKYEKGDAVREVAINAIRRGGLMFDEEKKQFVYKLETPLPNGDSDPVTQLTFKKRYKDSELERNLVGVREKDDRGQLLAAIAARVGISRLKLKNLMNDDMDIVTAVFVLFTRRV